MSNSTEQILPPTKLNTIPPLTFSNAANLTPGQYSVTSHEEKDVIAHQDNCVEHDIWFQTQPLDAELIKRIHSLKLFAESRDQGIVSDKKFGNWTWFEIAILTDNEPKARDGIKLAWVSHENRMKTKHYGWEQGMKFKKNHDIFRLLEAGDTIAVRLCARFKDWEIKARTGFLVFEMGKPIKREPLGFGQAKNAIISIQDIFQDINKQALPNAMLPSTPPKEMLFRAEMFTSATNDPIRVLSLDGGGVRGIASLMHLHAIMNKAAPGKKPCEIFDMIGGTSTGGLIAIMLGRLQMSVPDCIEQYTKFMDVVFPTSRWKNWDLFGTGLDLLQAGLNLLSDGAKWDATPLENCIKQLVEEKTGQDPDEVLLLDDDNTAKTCKVFVTATPREGANNSPPVLFRSYTNGLEKPEMPNIKIWEAARATSAAPAYFKPLTVNGKQFLDGGLLANNPLGWLWNEVLSVFGPARPTNCFLSLGTGLPGSQTVSDVRNLPGFALSMASVCTNSDMTNVLFRTLINAFAPEPMGKKYWRFNVGDGLPDWVKENNRYVWKNLAPRQPGDGGALDDVNAIKQVKKLTWKYLDLPAAKDMIAECALALEKK